MQFTTMEPGTFGKSCQINLYECDIAAITDADRIRKFVRGLVEAIDMRAFGEPQVIHFGPIEQVAGYSMTQLIETSLISGHFVDANGNAYIDVFSCKDYDIGTAIRVCREAFRPKRVTWSAQIRP